jgi:hypothetical protein
MSTPSPSSRLLPTYLRLAPLPSIFISHSSKDNTFGYQLANNLRNMGYATMSGMIAPLEETLVASFLVIPGLNASSWN